VQQAPFRHGVKTLNSRLSYPKFYTLNP
jgi:hypothetical protein